MPQYSLGLYEKAMPDGLSFREMLELTKRTGFDRLELSIDESDMRLARLDWTSDQVRGLKCMMDDSSILIRTMCLSGHRKYPLGSHDPVIRERSLEIMRKAVGLAAELGIAIIQLAGYDVYYETGDEETRAWFAQNLAISTEMAAKARVNMQEIQQITTQTTEGTRLTSQSIGQLSALAEELRASVAGFKVN